MNFAYTLQAIRSGKPLLLVDVICPHCEREHYASKARLIQPVTAIGRISIKRQPIEMQRCRTPLEEVDDKEFQIADLRQLKHVERAESIHAEQSLPDVSGTLLRPLSDTQSPSLPSPVPAPPGSSNRASLTSSAASQTDVVMQAVRGTDKPSPSRTKSSTTSRLTRLFSKTAISPAEHNVKHAWSADAAHVLIWNMTNLTILHAHSYKLIEISLYSEAQLAAMGSKLCAVVCADRGVSFSIPCGYHPLNLDRR